MYSHIGSPSQCRHVGQLICPDGYCWSSVSSALIDCCFACLDCSLRQNRVKHSLTLFLAITMSTSLFTRKGPGRSSYHGLDGDRNKKMVLPEEQLLVDTECQTANWAGWIGLPYRTGWVHYRVSRAGITESLKQQPLGTEPSWKVEISLGVTKPMRTSRLWHCRIRELLCQ